MKLRALPTIFLMLGVVMPVAGDDGETSVHLMLTNDDGIAAPGLAALAAELASDPGYRITVVAPTEQQSGQGTALAIGRDVEVRPYGGIHGCPAWSVAATPASAVRLGLTALLADDPPGLVVAGINRGENIGRSAWYSGTVGAAREAVLAGVPAVALSLELDWSNPRPDFAGAARWARPIVDAVSRQRLPAGCYLNVNLPRATEAIRGYRIARMGTEPAELSRYVMVRADGGAMWFRSQWRPPALLERGTDSLALEDGWVSIVPLGLDHTDYRALSVLEELELSHPEGGWTRDTGRVGAEGQ